MKRLIKFVLHNVPRKYIQRVVHLVTPIMGLLYIGRGAECPICSHRYRKFMPYGYVKARENALCPSCLALERHRLLWLYLNRETDFFVTPRKMLHIAPEYCFLKRRKSDMKLLEYVTADIESPLADVKMDVQAIPFGDNSFDLIYCNHILEHVEDDRLAMRELFRVMKQGGWGIMLSPVNPARKSTYEDALINTPEERERHFGQTDHMRDYGLDYADRLREVGFEVDEIDYSKQLPSSEVKLYGLSDDIIYRVRKL